MSEKKQKTIVIVPFVVLVIIIMIMSVWEILK